jgi:hypothetical protein
MAKVLPINSIQNSKPKSLGEGMKRVIESFGSNYKCAASAPGVRIYQNANSDIVIKSTPEMLQIDNMPLKNPKKHYNKLAGLYKNYKNFVENGSTLIDRTLTILTFKDKGTVNSMQRKPLEGTVFANSTQRWDIFNVNPKTGEQLKTPYLSEDKFIDTKKI